MIDPVKLAEKHFKYADTCKTVEYGDVVDAMWGMGSIELRAEDLEALNDGKVLYHEDGEYATLIRLSKGDK